MNVFRRLTIQSRLTLIFLTVTLLPLIGLAVLNDRTIRDTLTETAEQSLFAVASQTGASIDDFILTTRTTLVIEAQLPVISQYLQLDPIQRPSAMLNAEVRGLLYNLHQLHLRDQPVSVPYLMGYLLLDRDGSILFNTQIADGESNPLIGVDYSQRDFFMNPALLGEPYSSPIDAGDRREEPSIFFASRVSDELNRPLGVLVARYRINFLQEIISENNDLAGEGSFGVLFDENHIHLAHGLDATLIFKTVSLLPLERLQQLQTARRLPQGNVEDLLLDLPALEESLSRISEQPFFTAQDPPTGSRVNQVAAIRLQTYPWIVTFLQPREIFLEPAAEQTSTGILFTLLIAAVAVLASIVGARSLAAPITALTDVARKVAQGDLNVQAEASTEDELGLLARTFNDMTGQLRMSLRNLEGLVRQRTAQLQTTNEVGQAVSSILDPDQLVRHVVQLISERFGFYYAAIFLLDESGGWADLREATGEAGRILKERQHRLQVGGRSMVGSAISTRQARIALDVGAEPIRFDNPLLPDTRSEIALPLMVGERVLGALDVQSTKEAAFSQDDIQTLQNLANQVTVAIENARLFVQTQNLARRQALINDITARIQRAPDIQSILTTTVVELGRVLEIQEASVRLGVESEPAGMNGSQGRG